MKLAILVLSCAKYEERRQACRDTWAKNLPAGVAVHFVRGFADTQGTDEWLLPCPDTYPELPQKTRQALIKALKVYPDCSFFFKCDDDSLICVQRLLDYIATNPGQYCGKPMIHEWPVFASGGAGYLLSRKAAQIVAETMTIQQGAEDLSVARCLADAKIPLTSCMKFNPWNNPVPTIDNDLISAHYLTPTLMRQTWNNLQGQKIPKVFHWIWVGGKPMPDMFQAYIRGWMAKHPGWRGCLWGDELTGEEQSIGPSVVQKRRPVLHNQTQYDAAKTLAQKADILRYEILAHKGGVYLDTDMECLKNIEPLLQGIDGFSGAESDTTVAIGIMGCVPGHPLYGELIRELPASFAEYENVVVSTGPSFFTRYCLGRDDFRIYPPHIFYPIYYNGRQSGSLEMAFTDHKWSHSWAKP